MNIKFLDYQQELLNAYGELLKITEVQRQKESHESHVMMGAIVGADFQEGGVLVLGRATNGWHRYTLNTDGLFEGEDAIFDIPEKLDTILHDYQSKPGFWNVVSRTLKYFYGDNFQKNIVYSNYCKIAGEESNPSSCLAKIQQKVCSDILELELKITKPKDIIVLSGCHVENVFDLYSQPAMDTLLRYFGGEKFTGDWSPFLKESYHWGEKLGTEVYQVGDVTIYLTEHPERKKHDSHIATLQAFLSKYNHQQW